MGSTGTTGTTEQNVMQQDKSILSVVEFVKDLTFIQVKEKAETVPYNFKVSDFGELYMLSFTDKSNMALAVVRSMNGVVFEKETNKLIHFSFQKAYDGVHCEHTENEKDAYRGEKPENYDVEISTEGTHIKVYYYNDKWNIGTSRSIDASISHWGSMKSFKEMFHDCLEFEKIDIELLDKNHCYSWVMQHPENKVCNDIITPYCSMLNYINTETFVITRATGGFIVDVEIDQVINDVNDDRCNQNFLVYFADGRRIKLTNTNFKRIQDMVKNDPNIDRAYVRCLQNGRSEEMKQHFQSERGRFDFIDNRVNDVVRDIHRTYMDLHIRKMTDVVVFHKYEKSLKQLHWSYRQTREKITQQVVREYLLKLPVKILMWVLDLQQTKPAA